MNKLEWHTEHRKISALIPYERNPRTMTKKQVDDLKKSLEKFNLVEIPAIDTDNRIIAGHQRLKIMQMIGRGEEEIEVRVPNRQLTEEEFKEYNIRSNKNTGSWDFDLLANSFDTSDLVEWGFEEKELGIAPDEPKDAEPQIDRAEELNKKWQVKTGDLWQIGEHRLLCGDSTKAEDVARVMGGEKAAILLTDPPYGINIVRGLGSTDGAKAFGRVRQPGGKPAGVVGGKGIVEPRLYHPVIGDDKPFDPQFLMDYAPILILFGANHYASRLPDSPCWLVWDKGVSPDSTFSACELAWVNIGNHVKRYEHRWSGMVRAGNRHDELTDRIHPTQKPVGLMTQILNDYPGDNILDIFLGSGSTMVAVENLKRKCFGIEISPEYVACVLERMATAFPDLKIERIEYGR